MGYVEAIVSLEHTRILLENEREGAIRVLTSGAGVVQPHLVRRFAEMIDDEVVRGWEPPMAPDTLAYALVRIGEAFIYSDTVVGLFRDVARLHEVAWALLGLPPAERPRPRATSVVDPNVRTPAGS